MGFVPYFSNETGYFHLIFRDIATQFSDSVHSSKPEENVKERAILPLKQPIFSSLAQKSPTHNPTIIPTTFPTITPTNHPTKHPTTLTKSSNTKT